MQSCTIWHKFLMREYIDEIAKILMIFLPNNFFLLAIANVVLATDS